MSGVQSGGDGKGVDVRQERERALAADRRRVLSLPPEQALDAVLTHPYPVTLVQSMAEEDLYLLVHAIGPDDALPVLGLASNDQWEYMLDMEVWHRDRVHPHQLTEWLSRLLKADGDRFTHWVTGPRRDMLEYYFFRNIELHVREYEEDPAEVGDGFSTEDDVHYVRMRPYPDSNPQAQAMRDQFLGDLLRRLSVYDYPLYRGLLLTSAGVLGPETEEELLRLRNVRLAEKGFLPFEEAVGVYQPLRVADPLRRGRKPDIGGGRPVASYPIPDAATGSPAGAGRFAAILARIQDDLLLQRLQTEFAALCNQVIVADLQQVRERDALARVVEKVAGYIGIGLEVAETAGDGSDPYGAANLLKSHFLADLFRVGYGRALALKWQADRWRRESWFAANGWPLAFWGESWLGVLGGLLIKKPLFHDNYATGVLYREFAALADIAATETVLDRIMAVDRLLADMAVGPPPRPIGGLITYQNLLLTAWAHHQLGTNEGALVTVAPLPLDRFSLFFSGLWTPAGSPRRIGPQQRQDLLEWLSAAGGWPTARLAEVLGPVVDGLCGRVEEELASVSAKDLDPRFVQPFFLLAADHS